jgi:UDP-N-acetylglucosamine--N-acetylmuramyl-(pentapeptide) pyrophosphoryl-undecaprenol N-acetylglucosamine transferase
VRVVIAGGGTGGHVFPGIAVAEEFRKRDRKTQVMFIGTERGVEGKVIPLEGYPLRLLKTEGVLGKSPLRKVAAIWRLMAAALRSRAMYRHARPDVVIGTGGYASAGPVIAARTMRIPAMVMEQNLVPGLANRFLARLANGVAVTYYESMDFFPRTKTHLTGNPVRKRIMEGSREEALSLFSLLPERVTVFVVGGSAGARRINEAVTKGLDSLLDLREAVQFLHQTGESDYEKVRAIYRELGFRAMVAPFIHEMAEAYAAADVVVSRAGATTLAEIMALGKPSILVPYPHAAGHQEFNARKLLDVGGCRVVMDHELNGAGGGALVGHIRELVSSEELRSEMRRHARALGRPDAAQKVVDLALSLVRARSGNV